MEKVAELKKLAQEILKCTKCKLSLTRKNAVPGDGSLNADIILVGEAPGVQEDRQGLPFVGEAGKLLTSLLSSIGLSRTDVYITNIVKCRPPKNREPTKEEITTCLHYLRKQTSLIKPSLICTLGRIASETLIDKKLSISKEHGKLKKMGKITYLPLYHPAAALYNPKLKDTLFADIKILEKLSKNAKITLNNFNHYKKSKI